MRELGDVALESQLRRVLADRLGSLPLELTVEGLEQRRATRDHGRRLRRTVIGLGLAAALILPAGWLAAGTPFPRPAGYTYANEFVAAPDMSMSMAQPALVPLLDGRVLVIGDDGDGIGTTTRALVYDPVTGVSELTGPPLFEDSLWVESAIRLKDGKVLVIGNGAGQIFDPSTMRFEVVGPMETPRTGAATALLPDGRVLVAGGIPLQQDAAVSSAEVFDPATSTFMSTGSMGTSRVGSATATLPDGRIFVAPGESRKTAEVYDPSTGTFSAAGTMSTYFGGLAVALSDGRVVVLGSIGLRTQGLLAVWDPITRTFSDPRALPGPVSTATLLDDGRILMTGGRFTRWSGTYDPTGGGTRRTIEQPTTAWGPGAVRLADGRVLFVGGLVDLNVRPGASGGGVIAPALPTVEIFQ